MISRKISFTLLVLSALLTTAVACALKPIPQPLFYHHFADQRNWFAIPNAWNVLSNLPFALVGIGGLGVLFSSGKAHFIDARERLLWSGFSIGLILTSLGSSYYHLAPDNMRLVWDRLPMTVVFMSYVAALIGERISISLGLWLWPLLLALGFYSVFLWHASELRGAGDLRFYAALQVFTLLVTLLMLFTPSPYTRQGDLAIILVLFVLARVFEWFDHPLFALTHGLISGHTLKHLVAAVACAWVIHMIAKRKIKKGSHT